MHPFFREKTYCCALMLFIPLALLLLAGSAVLLYVQHQRDVDLALGAAETELVAARSIITSEIRTPITGLLFLASASDMDSIFYGTISDDCKKVILQYIKTYETFDQIRYLDNLGMEVFRVNHNNGMPFLVPKNQLQDKSNRYYFIEAIQLRQGEIYISPFDLNMEHGKIEIPRKPMIRFATKVYGSMGEQLGVVIVNYSGRSMLDQLATVPGQPGNRLMLLNEEGYWLKGDSPQDEWGFMYEDKQDRHFPGRYSHEWTAIANNWKSRQHTDQGTFASTTVCISDIVDQFTRPRAGQSDGCWKMVSHLPQSVLDYSLASFRHKILVVVSPVLLVLALGSLILTHLRTRSRRAEQMVLRQIESNARFVPREFLGLLNKDTFTEVDISDHVQRQMTTLFTDIRSYTKLSEGMTPEQVLRFLNNYYKVLDPIISEHNGFIDAFIGDAVMALFPEGPEGALKAAIQIQTTLRTFFVKHGDGQQNGIQTGIGLHCGEVTLGAVGTKNRLQTTAIGDAVNLSARIESATKLYDVSIIVSSGTVNALPDPTMFHLRSIDLVRVKGKQEIVELFEVFDTDPSALFEQKKANLRLFNEAMTHYRAGEFEQALTAFTGILERCPDDPIPAIFIKRSNTMLRLPPGPEWTGVSTL